MKNKLFISMLLVGMLSLPLVAQNSYTPLHFTPQLSEKGTLFGNEDAVQKRDAVVTPGNWGVGFHFGVGQNDPKTMKEIYDKAFDMGYSEKEITKRPAFFGVDAFYEWNLNNESNKLGAKIGLDIYGQNKLELNDGFVKATEDTYAFPITVYYKRDNGIKNFSWIAGAGATIMRTEAKLKAPGAGINEESSKSRLFPHLVVGAEYRFCKLFALGLEAKYNIAAKIKDDGDVLSNRSGFSGALTGRFYF